MFLSLSISTFQQAELCKIKTRLKKFSREGKRRRPLSVQVPKYESPHRAASVPWRLFHQYLPGVSIHGFHQKVMGCFF
jgi:hypothetical protein